MNEFTYGILSTVFIMGLSIVLILDITEPHKRIIKHGCAEYDTQTGDFKWIKKEKIK